ncbi:MAG: ABC transporter permease [Mucilaginibacter polytrichastri]|nr:ABC transporter permease [Mucilaginibacter polytrichastri]
MQTSFFIARRYLFSKKSIQAINIISGISMLGVFIGSAALVIILSVFNGFETLILSMFNNFTPEVRIEPVMGKTFDPQKTAHFIRLRNDPDVLTYTEVLQEKALVQYDNKRFIANVYGVSDAYAKNPGLDSIMLGGRFVLSNGQEDFAVIGVTVQYNLSVNINDDAAALTLFAPRRNAGNSIDPSADFTMKYIRPAGVFSVQQDFDDRVIVPLRFARELLDEPTGVSALELNFKRGVDVDRKLRDLQKQLGKNFLVKDRYQQNALMYKILNTEKWAIYLILTFILIVAIFNITGSLTMLVIDKRKDIAILVGLGAGRGLIQRIFFTEGMLISLIGCVGGMLLGLIFSLLQQKFGWIKMGGELSMIDAYPVDVHAADFLLVFLTVMLVSVVASSISARLSVKHFHTLKRDL